MVTRLGLRRMHQTDEEDVYATLWGNEQSVILVVHVAVTLVYVYNVKHDALTSPNSTGDISVGGESYRYVRGGVILRLPLCPARPT